jgi:hypothetical protein
MNPHFVEILKSFRDEEVEYLVIGAHALAAKCPSSSSESGPFLQVSARRP